jgi:mannose-1-phosphate guanylyltransferase/phosphomannomutase
MEGFTNANAVGAAPRTNLADALERVGRIVPTVGAAFGVVVGPTGEDVQFVDDEGEFVPPDVMLACFLERLRPKKAVLPINLSRSYEELIKGNGGELEDSRTGLGNVALKAARVGAEIAGLADGHYVFPTFLPAPDCFMTLARALELFREEPLSSVRARFGESFGGVRRRRLDCPWAAKGRVMRGLAEKFGGDPDAILTDGVKLNLDKGWVLMLPDPDNPLFYVYAEANAAAGTENGSRNGKNVTESLVSEYARLVEDLIESA